MYTITSVGPRGVLNVHRGQITVARALAQHNLLGGSSLNTLDAEVAVVPFKT